MIHTKTFLASLVGALLVIGMVVSYSTVIKNAPPDFDLQESTGVNVSCAINVSGFPYLAKTGWARNKTTGTNFSDHRINVTVSNKSSDSGAYSILAETLSLTINATNRSPEVFWNYTVTLTEGDRHWLFCNFTNVSRNDDGSYGGAITSVSLVQIDAERKILGFDTYNFSYITADGTKSYCGVSDANIWGCVG